MKSAYIGQCISETMTSFKSLELFIVSWERHDSLLSGELCFHDVGTMQSHLMYYQLHQSVSLAGVQLLCFLLAGFVLLSHSKEKWSDWFD